VVSRKDRLIADYEMIRSGSLYKQATEGDVKVKRPGMLDMLGRAKW
jgi:acyl-CoA-binding protein